VYERLRSECPVGFDATTSSWLVSSFSACREVLIAALLAACGPRNGVGVRADVDDMLMTQPPPAFIIDVIPL
jgi:hypothetical protein